MSEMKDRFITIYKENISRIGADKLLEWLEGSDFFGAPASTRYHLSVPGGLVTHSVHVYERLSELCQTELNLGVAGRGTPFKMPSEETIAIVSLLHDVCKANFYAVEMRNRKNEQGQWERYPFYIVNDQLPYGHGEKSVYIISGFMRLRREEAMAIRWHMGSWQDGEKQNAGNAFGKYPLALLTHIADMQATYLDETGGGAK